MRWTLPLVVFCGLALPTRAPAWHKDGHMAVARIAWQQLDQKQKDWATRILKAHAHDGLDHYQLFLTAGRPTRPGEEIPVDEWAFARAAAWPDWVRDPRRETPAHTPEQSDAIRAKFTGAAATSSTCPWPTRPTPACSTPSGSPTSPGKPSSRSSSK